MSQLRYKPPRYHPTNLLTSAPSISGAIEELAQKLGEVTFPNWVHLLKRDFVNQRLRLDSWDELGKQGHPNSSFSSRKTIMQFALSGSVYTSACPVIISNAYDKEEFLSPPNQWAGYGIYGIQRGQYKVVLDRGNDEIHLKSFYSSKQTMCDSHDIRYDFMVVVNKNFDLDSPNPRDWVRATVMPILIVSHRASALLCKHGLADRFTDEMAGLISFTGHDFPLHAATDGDDHIRHSGIKEAVERPVSEMYDLVERINGGSPVNKRNEMLYGYENLCLDLNSAIFYIAREKGFDFPLLRSTSQLSMIADELKQTGDGNAQEFAKSMKQIAYYFLSNYIERNLLNNSKQPLPDILMKEKAGRISNTVPIQRPACASKGDTDWLSLAEATRLFGVVAESDAQKTLTKPQENFVARFANKRSEFELG
jgi:hypothetical protein